VINFNTIFDTVKTFFWNLFRNPRKTFNDLVIFASNNWLLLIFLFIYYKFASKFFIQSLSLFKAGKEGLPAYYNFLNPLPDSVITPLSITLPFLFTLLFFGGIHFIKKGYLNPGQSDRMSQYLFLLASFPLVLYFILQLVYLNQTDKSWYFDLDYMDKKAGFLLSNDWPWETELEDTRWKYYFVGISNAVRVVIISIILCTIIGIFMGVARLSTNILLSKLAETYVEFFRNMPLVVQLFFWLTILGDILPRFDEMINIGNWIYISNRTVMAPRLIIDSNFFLLLTIITFVGFRLYVYRLDKEGFDDSDEGLRKRFYLWTIIFFLLILFSKIAFTLEQPELVKTNPNAYGTWYFNGGEEISLAFIALMFGLTIYTSVQVAEIVRGSIQSLPRGQIESAISLGLSSFQRLRLIILPQALRSMIPPLNNQYLNCWKNSSLAMIISFSDHFAVSMTIVNNAGQAVPVFIILLLTYQTGSLLISAIMNYLNSKVTSVKI